MNIVPIVNRVSGVHARWFILLRDTIEDVDVVKQMAWNVAEETASIVAATLLQTFAGAYDSTQARDRTRNGFLGVSTACLCDAGWWRNQLLMAIAHAITGGADCPADHVPSRSGTSVALVEYRLIKEMSP